MAHVTVRLTGEKYQTEMKARNHTWIADEPADSGGNDSGPMPTEIVLGALGACAAITARLYAERKGWPLEGVEVTLDSERFNKGDYPAYNGEAELVHQIRQAMVFRGPLTDDQKKRLMEIAARCPVHKLLTNPVFIVDELIKEETPA